MPHRGLTVRVSDCHLLALMHRIIAEPDMSYTVPHKRQYLSLTIESARLNSNEFVIQSTQKIQKNLILSYSDHAKKSWNMR